MIIEIFLIFIAFSTICHSQPTPPPLVRNIAVGIGVVSSLDSYILIVSQITVRYSLPRLLKNIQTYPDLR